MQSWLEREYARVEYFSARSTVRAEELVQKEAAAEAAERQEQAAAAAREAEITGRCPANPPVRPSAFV